MLRRPLLPAALALVGALACGDNVAGVLPIDASLVDAGPRACVPVVGEPELGLEPVASGFTKPVHVTAPPGDPRLFVLEQHTGRVRLVDAGGVVLPRAFLDLGGQVGQAMEQGLVSLAFHPRYADNRRFFISFTRAGDDALVVEEWLTRADDPDRADEGTRKTILDIAQPTDFHHAGRIAFGPDGYLYLGHGDGGPQHDPEGHTQDLGLLLGKFLRIDIDREDAALGLPYAIPADNPFVGTAGARGEIYALGVRNPWGWSIDAATGHLFFGDVGLARWEEVNVIPGGSGGGQNFGWPVLMGNECETAGCDPTGMTAPLVVYPWATLEFCAVVGGPVYRGCRMPGHHGRTFYSDFCAGYLRSFRWSALDPAAVAVTEHSGASNRLLNTSGIGVDGDGEMIMLDWEAGTLHRVVPLP